MMYGQMLLAFLIMSVSIFAVAGDSNPQQGSKNIDRNAVVVELFTSEGCSTCPPADEFLARLSARQPIGDVGSSHWRNMSITGITTVGSILFLPPNGRCVSKDYAARLSGSGTYTPQMIIDGQREMVGSREADIEQAILEAAHREKTKVDLHAEGVGGSRTKQFTVSVETLREVPIATTQRSGLPSRKEISDRPSEVGRMPERIYLIQQYCEPCARSAWYRRANSQLWPLPRRRKLN